MDQPKAKDVTAWLAQLKVDERKKFPQDKRVVKLPDDQLGKLVEKIEGYIASSRGMPPILGKSGRAQQLIKHFKRYIVPAALATLSAFPLSTRRWDRSRLFGLSTVFSVVMVATTIDEQPRAAVTATFFALFFVKLLSFFGAVFSLKAPSDVGQRGLGIFRLNGEDNQQMNHWNVKGSVEHRFRRMYI